MHRAWLKNIQNKVHGREKKAQIYHALGEIMHSCHDDESVQDAVKRMLEKFQDQKKFINYFQKTWLANNKIRK